MQRAETPNHLSSIPSGALGSLVGRNPLLELNELDEVIELTLAQDV
jgi:hypothetical protein